MNRRRFLLGASGLAGAGWVEIASAQETPVAIPAPTEAVPTATSEPRDYAAAVAHGLALGRQASDWLAAGDTAAIFAWFSPELQTTMSIEQLEETLRDVTTNRAHFQEPGFRLIFDGRVAGDAMAGVLQSSERTPFSLRRSNATPETAPAAGTPLPAAALAGHWSGATELSDGSRASLVVDLAADGQTGTLSLPDQSATVYPLTSIAFAAEQPLGERTHDGLMPYSPARQHYRAVYDWGGRGLDVSLVFDAADRIGSLQLSETWLLAPDPAAELPALPAMHLPVEGRWWVSQGGETVYQNEHASNREQRHAVDLLIWQDGATFRADGAANADYVAWGEPVLAPIDAIVVETVDGSPDNPPGTRPDSPDNPFGNHVVLQVGNNAFLYLAHLQEGSIAVARGNQISAGTLIGLVGNSGNSTEPQLHIHAQSYGTLRAPGVGLPLTFADVLVDDELMEVASLVQGGFVEQG